MQPAFYYWTRGWALVLAMIGLACLVFCLCSTAAVLVIYSLQTSSITPRATPWRETET